MEKYTAPLDLSRAEAVEMAQLALQDRQHEIAASIVRQYRKLFALEDKALLLRTSSNFGGNDVMEVLLCDSEPELLQFLTQERYSDYSQPYYVELLMNVVKTDATVTIPLVQTANTNVRSYELLRNLFDYDQDALSWALMRTKTFRIFSDLLPDIEAPNWKELLQHLEYNSTAVFAEHLEIQWARMIIAVQKDDRFEKLVCGHYTHVGNMVCYVLNSCTKTASRKALKKNPLEVWQLYAYAAMDMRNDVNDLLTDASPDWPTLYAAACEYGSIETFNNLINLRSPNAQELVQAISCTTSQEMLSVLLNATPAVPTWETLMGFRDSVSALTFLLDKFTFQAKENPFKKVEPELEIVQLFVDAGYDIKADGAPILRRAAMFGKQDVVEYVFSFGLDLSLKPNRRGTKLVLATEDGTAMNRAFSAAVEGYAIDMPGVLLAYEGMTVEFIDFLIDVYSRPGHEQRVVDILEQRRQELSNDTQ
jgi:hypothetical protein